MIKEQITYLVGSGGFHEIAKPQDVSYYTKRGHRVVSKDEYDALRRDAVESTKDNAMQTYLRRIREIARQQRRIDAKLVTEETMGLDAWVEYRPDSEGYMGPRGYGSTGARYGIQVERPEDETRLLRRMVGRDVWTLTDEEQRVAAEVWLSITREGMILGINPAGTRAWHPLTWAYANGAFSYMEGCQADSFGYVHKNVAVLAYPNEQPVIFNGSRKAQLTEAGASRTGSFYGPSGTVFEIDMFTIGPDERLYAYSFYLPSGERAGGPNHILATQAEYDATDDDNKPMFILV